MILTNSAWRLYASGICVPSLERRTGGTSHLQEAITLVYILKTSLQIYFSSSNLEEIPPSMHPCTCTHTMVPWSKIFWRKVMMETPSWWCPCHIKVALIPFLQINFHYQPPWTISLKINAPLKIDMKVQKYPEHQRDAVRRLREAS